MKRPIKTAKLTFGQWLRETDQLDTTTLWELSDAFSRIDTGSKRGDHKGFHMGPSTFTAFLAKTYPAQFVTYQTYLRLTGADTIKIERE
jgi:hypothetical protein